MGDEHLSAKWPLSFWGSQEELDVNIRLDFLEDYAIPYNPARSDIYRSLELVSLSDCRVAIFGESPYADPKYATGVAFSCHKSIEIEGYTIPDPRREVTPIPPSLRTIFRGYSRDLSLPFPTHGCLEGWCDQGVLLWNISPTAEIEKIKVGWKTYTHKHWKEWKSLSKQIIRKLSDKGEIVFVFLGFKASEYAKYVNVDNNANTVLTYRHPSPLSQMFAKEKFIDNRMLSTINSKLIFHNKEIVDWRLT
jgi:uracil-DNA glycosylase